MRLTENQLRESLTAQQKVNEELFVTICEMSKILDCDSDAESCLLKLIELDRLHSSQRTLLAQKSDEKEEFEFEQRAARETILRLSGELNKEQREKEAANESTRAMKSELQRTRTLLDQSEQRTRLLEDRIQNLTSTLQSARQDADEKDKKLALLADSQSRLLEKRSKRDCGSNEFSEVQFLKQVGPQEAKVLDALLEKMAHWFSIPEGEDAAGIVSVAQSRIPELIEQNEERKQKLRNAENQLAHFTQTQCSYELESHLKDRIEELEVRRASDGVVIDQLRREKLMLTDRLQQIAIAAKLDGSILALDMEAVCNALAMRVDQLQQGDTESQAKQRLQISRLQRQLKEAKEKTEALELQVSVLRSRLAETQERSVRVTTPASQTPMSLASSERERRRLAKQLQQTKEEAEHLRREIVHVKARLLDSSQDKLKIVGQAKTVRSNQVKFDQLNRECEWQKTEMQKLQNEFQQATIRYKQEIQKMQNEISMLKRELGSTKEALETSHRSEKQLLDFRSLVARHLGLNCEQMTIPDYQIMVQLHRLVTERRAQSANETAVRKAVEIINGQDIKDWN